MTVLPLKGGGDSRVFARRVGVAAPRQHMPETTP